MNMNDELKRIRTKQLTSFCFVFYKNWFLLLNVLYILQWKIMRTNFSNKRHENGSLKVRRLMLHRVI